MRILSIFGTRPEAIKMAPIIRELQRHAPQLTSRVCVTGQHRDMLDQVLALFAIVPHYDLSVMRDAQSPTQVAATVLSRLEPILQKERPDWVLVQGDTTTAMAASLAAFYAGLKVGHVEAGLRTHDNRHPFPEEVNRRITSVLADLHFAPTDLARTNLEREGIPPSRIRVTGNTVIDALKHTSEQPYNDDGGVLLRLPQNRRLLLVTAHRRENFGAPLERICLALRRIAARFRDEVHIVYPVHRNPSVLLPVTQALDGEVNISLIPPIDYQTTVQLLKRCYLVLTDSGGLQEEAPSLGRPVLVLRETTERPEGVEAGTARLVGTDVERLEQETARLLEDPMAYSQMARAINPYGDGRAAERIVSALV